MSDAQTLDASSSPDDASRRPVLTWLSRSKFGLFVRALELSLSGFDIRKDSRDLSQ